MRVLARYEATGFGYAGAHHMHTTSNARRGSSAGESELWYARGMDAFLNRWFVRYARADYPR
jgi:hypothetical protein